MVFAGKGWEIACYLITTSLYVLLKAFLFRRYRHAKLHHIHVSLRDEDRNFLYVWFLLYILRFWGTLRFFLYAFGNPPQSDLYMEVFLRMQAFGDPGQAFVNFFLFCILDKTVRDKIKHGFCCRGRNDPVRTKLLSSAENEGSNNTHLNDDVLNRESCEYGSLSPCS